MNLIPSELLYTIYNFLDFRSLFTISFLNKKSYEIIHSNYFWIQRSNIESYDTFCDITKSSMKIIQKIKKSTFVYSIEYENIDKELPMIIVNEHFYYGKYVYNKNSISHTKYDDILWHYEHIPLNAYKTGKNYYYICGGIFIHKIINVATINPKFTNKIIKIDDIDVCLFGNTDDNTMIYQCRNEIIIHSVDSGLLTQIINVSDNGNLLHISKSKNHVLLGYDDSQIIINLETLEQQKFNIISNSPKYHFTYPFIIVSNSELDGSYITIILNIQIGNTFKIEGKKLCIHEFILFIGKCNELIIYDLRIMEKIITFKYNFQILSMVFSDELFIFNTDKNIQVFDASFQ